MSDAVSPMHNLDLLVAPVSESQRQVPALTVNSDVIMPSIEQGFDFSTFLEDETSSNIVSDNSMVDPSLDSMDFFYNNQGEASSFEMAGDSLLEDFDFSLPDFAEQGQDIELPNSMDTNSKAHATGYENQDHGELNALFDMSQSGHFDQALSVPMAQMTEVSEQDAPLQHDGVSLPSAPISEMPAAEYQHSHPQTGSHTSVSHAAAHYSVPSHEGIEMNVGQPPVQPHGCSEAKRSGWDDQGWWYKSKHDGCPLPITHRHDTNGQVSFTGMGDVLKMVNEIMGVARRGH
ncbi:hypothetical protein E8E14_009214 [Neopestalotiopsis sp. 37M]|nr:hypothetical protein E8E14_009214 [Neopestalotiopsis sp. 37M]